MKINFNDRTFKKIVTAADRALAKTGEAVLTDLIQSGTMPFDTGEMQNNRTFVDMKNINKGDVVIRTNSPQARRLYYHPEYNFQKGKNANAGGRWFDPYLPNGKKGGFAQKAFATLMRREMGG